MARWRALFETTVVLSVLSKGNGETVERFDAHYSILNNQLAKLYELYQQRAALYDIDPEVVEEAQRAADEVEREAGRPMKSSYGWAIPYLDQVGIPHNDRPGLRDLAEAVELDYLLPYYTLASYFVHTNAKTLQQASRLVRDFSLVCGASNGGLSLPGRLAAISIYQATTLLLAYSPRDVMTPVTMKVLLRFVDAVSEAFLDAEAKYQDETQADE